MASAPNAKLASVGDMIRLWANSVGPRRKTNTTTKIRRMLPSTSGVVGLQPDKHPRNLREPPHTDPISSAMNSDLLDAMVIGGGTAFWSLLFASLRRRRAKIIEEARHRGRLGLSLNGVESVLLAREDASLKADLRRDPRRSLAYKAGQYVARVWKAGAGKRAQKV